MYKSKKTEFQPRRKEVDKVLSAPDKKKNAIPAKEVPANVLSAHLHKLYPQIKFIPDQSINNCAIVRDCHKIFLSYADYILKRDLVAQANYWFNRVEKWIVSEGSLVAMKRIKAMRMLYTKYIAGDTNINEKSITFSINKKRLPSLKPLNVLAKGDIWDQRALFALLSISRALKVEVLPPSTQSIEDPYSGKDPYALKSDIRRVLGDMKISLPRPVCDSVHVTTKQGPNGLAMLTAVRDARALSPQQKRCIELMGGSGLTERIAKVRQIDPSLFEQVASKGFKPSPIMKTGMLGIVSQPEGKKRYIAIMDYWSQACLKPLHDSIFSLLKKLESDCTFDQGSAHEWLKDGPYFCYDLSNATDRFPIAFQEIILEYLIDGTYAKAWRFLISDRGFYKKSTNSFIFYRCGQPMGAYSSWACFALAHHVLVRLSADKCGLKGFTNYCLLGDDIVIANEAVANEYLKLCEYLGVGINYSKSIISKTHYEFAKRFVKADTKEELSGFTFQGILEARGKYHLLANELRQICYRYHLDIDQTDPGFITALHPNTDRLYRKRLTDKAMQFLLLPFRGYTQQTNINNLIKLSSLVFKEVLSCNHRNSALDIIQLGLSETKAKMIEAAMLNLRKLGAEFINKSDKFTPGLNRLVSQTILSSIPVVEVTVEQQTYLLNEIEKLRDPKITTTTSLVFNEALHTSFDASRLLATRNHELIQDNNATLLNRLRQWAKEYKKVNDYCMSYDYDENIGRGMMRKIFRTETIGSLMPHSRELLMNVRSLDSNIFNS